MLHYQFGECESVCTHPLMEVVLLLDKEGIIINCSESTIKELGNIRSEKFQRFVYLDDMDVWNMMFLNERMIMDIPVSNPLRLYALNKEVKYYRATMKSYKNYFILSLINIDIEIKLKEQLDESLNRFKTVVDDTLTAICITDTNGKYKYVNKGYCNVYGYTKEELIGQHFTIVVPEEKRELLCQLHDEFFLHKVEVEGEWEVINKKGERLTILASAAYIIGEDGEPKKVTFIMDITERKIAEQKLQTYAAKLEEKSKELKSAYDKTQADIEKAKLLHLQFFPGNHNLSNEIAFEAFYHPAEQLGGDYYNFFKLNEDQLVIYISDVSGHGLDGAMMNIYLKNTIDLSLANAADQNKAITPKEIIHEVISKYSHDGFGEDYFICLWFAILDLNNFNITYCSTGLQTPMVLISSDDEVEIKELGGLPISTAIPLELYVLEENQITLDKGKSVLLLTDGLIEEERNGRQFGVDGLLVAIEKSNKKQVKYIKQEIVQSFMTFTGDEHSTDDLTFILLQRKS